MYTGVDQGFRLRERFCGSPSVPQIEATTARLPPLRPPLLSLHDCPHEVADRVLGRRWSQDEVEQQDGHFRIEALGDDSLRKVPSIIGCSRPRVFSSSPMSISVWPAGLRGIRSRRPHSGERWRRPSGRPGAGSAATGSTACLRRTARAGTAAAGPAARTAWRLEPGSAIVGVGRRPLPRTAIAAWAAASIVGIPEISESAASARSPSRHATTGLVQACRRAARRITSPIPARLGDDGDHLGRRVALESLERHQASSSRRCRSTGRGCPFRWRERSRQPAWWIWQVNS